MVEAVVVVGMVEHAFPGGPERRGASSVEVQGFDEPQQTGDIGRFGDGGAFTLAPETTVDDGHHHLAVGPLADQRAGMTAGVESLVGIVFDDPAAVDQHGARGQHRTVTARHLPVFRRVAEENIHLAAFFVLESDNAVGADQLPGGGASHDLSIDRHERHRLERPDIEITAVNGHVRPGSPAQFAHSLGPTVEMNDPRFKSPPGITDDGDALPGAEHIDLSIAASGPSAEVGDAPFGSHESNRIGRGGLGRRCKGIQGEQCAECKSDHNGH